ncbi:MAG: sulfite exporter TauE/SafE family protein [Deltaproteobacteria bacterium]|nr:sulfite exporter TauE/SafE family protein [Deltaproteobacteria bacterium]
MQTYVLICMIVFFSGFIQGLSGFGSIMLSLPLLALFIDVKVVIPLVGIFGLVIPILLLIKLWKHLDWKKIYPLFLGALPGIPVGVFFLKKFDVNTIQLILGIILVTFSIYSLFLKSFNRGLREGWAYVFGFFGGCIGGALSAAGLSAIVYTSLQTWGKDKIKATLQGFLLASHLVIVILQAVNGLITTIVLWYLLVSLPTLILGTYVGALFYGRINEDFYKKTMLILLAILGALMLYRS